MSKVKFIYNPKAGAKRSFFTKREPGFVLESIRALLRKYEIECDESPTRAAGDARRIAAQAAKDGYETVIVAGGDGTVGEAANGLIGTNVVLGILPLGTFMNVARMLDIPFDLEQAVMVIKMNNVRLIDVGEILSIEGDRPSEPTFFLESSSIGLEADFQNEFLAWERGDASALGRFLRRGIKGYRHPLHVELDNNRSFESRAHVIMISNGPYAGSAIPVAPNAKLNDSLLTVRRYHMSKFELVQHVLSSLIFGSHKEPKIEVYTSANVRVTSKSPRTVHADGRIFGKTPITITLRPKALHVITGYPASVEESALLAKKTYLAP